MDELLDYRKVVQAAGGRTAVADSLVQGIAHSEDFALLPPLLARLADESDRIGWFLDCDYAAAALQAAYSQTASPQLKLAMLKFALERTRWVDPHWAIDAKKRLSAFESRASAN